MIQNRLNNGENKDDDYKDKPSDVDDGQKHGPQLSVNEGQEAKPIDEDSQKTGFSKPETQSGAAKKGVTFAPKAGLNLKDRDGKSQLNSDGGDIERDHKDNDKDDGTPSSHKGDDQHIEDENPKSISPSDSINPESATMSEHQPVKGGGHKAVDNHGDSGRKGTASAMDVIGGESQKPFEDHQSPSSSQSNKEDARIEKPERGDSCMEHMQDKPDEKEEMHQVVPPGDKAQKDSQVPHENKTLQITPPVEKDPRQSEAPDEDAVNKVTSSGDREAKPMEGPVGDQTNNPAHRPVSQEAAKSGMGPLSKEKSKTPPNEPKHDPQLKKSEVEKDQKHKEAEEEEEPERRKSQPKNELSPVKEPKPPSQPKDNSRARKPKQKEKTPDDIHVKKDSNKPMRKATPPEKKHTPPVKKTTPAQKIKPVMKAPGNNKDRPAKKQEKEEKRTSRTPDKRSKPKKRSQSPKYDAEPIVPLIPMEQDRPDIPSPELDSDSDEDIFEKARRKYGIVLDSDSDDDVPQKPAQK